ncbi:amidohydrolase [Nocardioides speluncae]|uniref:amidohydrolase n=1 Tax=Nocardioides speluncae TaxID=2670337 RepID=UPI000D68E8EF|nr:amidohydrolase family protein [Nocardioides speluncae]
MSLLLRRTRPVPICTAVPDQPVDVRIEGGRVAEVGPSLARPRGTEEYDAEGRWLIPGLWDQHVHLGQWAVSSARLDLAGATSAEAAVKTVAAQLAERPGEPVVGWGHRSTAWPHPPATSDLDRIAPTTPVVLISGDGHHAWLNSAAFAGLGLAHRDGVVAEAEWFAAYGRLPELVEQETPSASAYRRAMLAAAARGVVGLTDFEFSGGADEWAERWAAGANLVRVRMATYAEGLDAVLAAGLRTGDPLPGCDPRATMGSLKIISDGALNTKTAWCCEPYADGSAGSGAPNLTAAELSDLLGRAHAAGLTVATHAIGDAAAAAALTAYAETGARGTIEHAQLVRLDDVRQMAELGLAASVQPAHLLDDRDATERLWPDRTGRCFPLRWLVDAGVELRLGSDAPVAPLDPWLAMAAACHRTADDRAPWHPEQALTASEALAASTDGRGTVAAGHPADLVLLDADPLAEVGEVGDSAAVGAHLRGLAVHATYVAGVRVG